MKTSKRVLTFTIVATLVLPVYADDFDNRFYGGIGLGISQLEPGTDNTGYEVEDKQDFGGKVYLGMDFAKNWGAELYYGDLGAAALENAGLGISGEIEYKVFGLSGLYHFYNNHGTEGLLNRSGWDWFVKAGIGSLDNSSDLPFRKQKGTHVMLGLGTEYEWDNGFAIRLEGETFDEDVQLFSLGLLKRFGGSSADDFAAEPVITPAPVAEPDVAPEPEPQPQIQVAPAPVNVVIEAPEPVDDDKDGVTNESDICPDTVAGAEVNEKGCDVFSGVLEGVQFESGSSNLTEQSRVVLDGVAEKLQKSPDVRVAIMAHTDNSGAAKANLDLSKQRAISVVRYLMSKGIKINRMRPEAYGESRPRATNATPEGRFANRRVEFRRIN